MNSSIVTLAGLFLVYATTIAMVSCLDTRGETLTRDEIIALTRDYRARIDPDLLLNGFFPVWALIQVLIGCFFFIIAVVGCVCYVLGFRTPPEEMAQRKK